MADGFICHAFTTERYLREVTIPALALAGCLASRRTRPRSVGAVPSEGGMFVAIVLGTAMLVGALTYFAVLALGPVVEQLALVRAP